MNIDPRKLYPHPFNTAVYGVEVLDPDFVKSIREKGFIHPVDVVSTNIGGRTGFYILNGHRRVEAAKEIGVEVPIRVLPDQGSLWQESYLLEANRQRAKTPEQMAREYTEQKRIELAEAEARRAAGERVQGTASERAATKIGIHEPWARKMEVVVKAADAGNPVAVQGLAEINTGKATPDSVYRSVLPKEEKAALLAHHEETAMRLKEAIGFFDVKYSPRATDPQHGFVFRARFVCVEEAEAFIRLLSLVPKDEMENFVRQSKSWQK